MIGGASRDPGARRIRLLGRIRDRALLPQRARADHLRGHDADPQADAGRARARLPQAERRRRRLADRGLGARARADAVVATATQELHRITSYSPPWENWDKPPDDPRAVTSFESNDLERL